MTRKGKANRDPTQVKELAVRLKSERMQTEALDISEQKKYKWKHW